MKRKLLAGVGIALVLLLVVATCGCTSTSNNSSSATTASTPSTPALTLTAQNVGTTTAADGSPIVEINATITNNHAGTLQTSSGYFYLQDSSGAVTRTMTIQAGGVGAQNVLNNGETGWTDMHFNITPGSHPTQLTYYDGTHNLVCSISS
jgi:hypothetical protein